MNSERIGYLSEHWLGSLAISGFAFRGVASMFSVAGVFQRYVQPLDMTSAILASNFFNESCHWCFVRMSLSM